LPFSSRHQGGRRPRRRRARGIQFRAARNKIQGVPPDPRRRGTDGNINAVMDGDPDGFINAYLAMKAGR
jgi:hypothetical protein